MLTLLPLFSLAETNVYRILINNLELLCSIGIHPFEKEAPQRVLINVELWLKHGDITDEIHCVLDYDSIRSEILTLASSAHFNLQEKLCAKIVELCMSKSEVLAVKVSTEKIDVYPDCSGVGCEMFKMKDELRKSYKQLTNTDIPPSKSL